LPFVSLILFCGPGATSEGVSGTPDEVDPSIYFRIDDPNDPFRAKYAEFRARRERDMASPDSPRPLDRYPARHQTRLQPWGELEALLPFDWQAIRAVSPEHAKQLEASVRIRLGFDHPDLKITQVMIGPGGLLPAHADGAPGAFVVVGGEGEITVEGETWRLTPGATVKLHPYDVRRLRASPSVPLRLLWIRWAPGGDQAYIDAGYYLTGANQHIQPKQADLPEDYLFWDQVFENEALEQPSGPLLDPPPGSVYARSARALDGARRALGAERALYPGVPVFGHESRVPWLSAETLRRGGFFFSDDLESLGPVADRMIQIARHKAIFRATRADGRWDFNFSQSAWGARSTYVEHSHVIPEFYYVLSGPVIYGVDGERYESLPGDILFNNSYSPHLVQGIVDGLVFDCFSSTFAPNGDRSVFERPYFLVEPLGGQPASARLAKDVAFH
jgi:quercetin dioxygenase-like cupin family protein